MNKFTPKLISMAITLSFSHAWADELPEILIVDTLSINPNASTLEEVNRTYATGADGGDFLRQINGISASRFGGRGLEPILRGQSQTRLNILLDGAYVHGGCPNRMDPPASWAALETYENVTVLKGVQTLIYGGGGSGGTVLFERDSRALAEEKGVHGRFNAGGSDNGLKTDFSADILGAGEAAYVRAFAQVKSADNYTDGDGREVRSAYDHQQGGLVLGLTPKADRLAELTYENNQFDDVLYPGAGMDSPEESGDFYRFKYEDKPAATWLNSIKIEANVSDVDHLMDNFSLRTPPNYPPASPLAGTAMLRETPTTSQTTGGRIVLNSGAGKTRWVYGLDLQNNDRDAVLNKVDGPSVQALSYLWPGVTIDQAGIFAEATTALSDTNRFKYGLRIDSVSASAAKADDKPLLASPNMAYNTYYGIKAEDQEETNVGGLARYEVDLNPKLSLFTGLSRSLRTADATERYMNKWNPKGVLRWVGNPNLKPEQHHQFDIGLAGNSTKNRFSAVVFYDDVSDYILRDTARGQDGILLSDKADIYRNVDANLSGLELEGVQRLTDVLDLSGSLAYVRATNTTDDDRPIAQIPPLSGKIQLDFSKRSWGLGTRLRFADEQDRIDEFSKQEVGETDSWAVLDIYGNYSFNETFSLRYGVDNLFDETYALHASRSNLMDPFAIKVNEPGRIVWLKATVDL